jgi:alpha-amylase/alpha-mannosidase (GH57 family)
MIKLSLFWHMHQPDYRNGAGVMRMPWVFLHAIKDYYEMPWLLSNFPTLKATFNLTPSLIEQLRLYEAYGYHRDLFLSLWLKHPCELGDEERAWVMKICNSPQFETMVKPLPRYTELYGKEHLDDHALIELEVLFMLSWCGNYLRHHNATVQHLIEKGRAYSSEDKEALLDTLLQFIPTILPLYKILQERGQISLATTPFNHPILPLLLDMNNAQKSNPQTAIPNNHQPLVDDAKAQIRRAIQLYQEVFGRAPTGFWPAEGAVDEKSVALYKSYGLRWIATDEAILFKSLGKKRSHELYRRHHFDNLFIAFRDHALSDLIGFTYRYWEAEDSAENFLSHLREIGKKEKHPTISVILDGENAWEFYPNNGYDFFQALYQKLTEAKDCQTVTMDELADEKPQKRLKHLHPGSWIYGTFDTWVGHPEKNEAWELIYRTKEDYLAHIAKLSNEVRSAITDHFLISECSDWFWWYGEDHHTEYAKEFDQLFRNHLIEIYNLMNIAVPASLFRSIAGESDVHALMSEPKFPIHPTIDGKVSSFFEWLGSGMVDETRVFSTMDRVRGPISKTYWGEDEHAIYLRLDGDMEALKEAGEILIYVDVLSEAITINLSSPTDGEFDVAIDEIVEIALPKQRFEGYQSVRIRLEVVIEQKVVQTLPGVAELVIDLSDNFSENWFI